MTLSARRASLVPIDEVYALANWIYAQRWPLKDPPVVPQGWHWPLDERYPAMQKVAGKGAWFDVDLADVHENKSLAFAPERARPARGSSAAPFQPNSRGRDA
jgi:hypothetical protein